MGSDAAVPDVLFLGSTYAGHRARFGDLQDAARAHSGFRSRFREISGWRESGALERLPLPRALAGRMRPVFDARAFLTFPRPDVVWTSGREELLPWAMAASGLLSRPVLLDLDATDAQLEEWAGWYWGRRPRTGMAAAFAAWRERAVFRKVALFTPWSQWAAAGLAHSGVDAERVRVLPPGVDLERWQPGPPTEPSDRLRGLFIGGDFVRKGGDLLLQAAKALSSGVEIDLVTRDATGPLPANVRAWRLERGDTHLSQLLASADFFVLPSRAECFGIATIEAMACGLPAVVSNVGAAPEIVEDGVTGHVIEPSAEALAGAIKALASDRARTAAMGRAARARAERRFDGRVNSRKLFTWIEELAARRSALPEPVVVRRKPPGGL